MHHLGRQVQAVGNSAAVLQRFHVLVVLAASMTLGTIAIRRPEVPTAGAFVSGTRARRQASPRAHRMAYRRRDDRVIASLG